MRVFHADCHMFAGDFDQRCDVCAVGGRRIEACMDAVKVNIGFERILDFDYVF